jgi:hypothetical protein
VSISNAKGKGASVVSHHGGEVAAGGASNGGAGRLLGDVSAVHAQVCRVAHRQGVHRLLHGVPYGLQVHQYPTAKRPQAS